MDLDRYAATGKARQEELTTAGSRGGRYGLLTGGVSDGVLRPSNYSVRLRPNIACSVPVLCLNRQEKKN